MQIFLNEDQISALIAYSKAIADDDADAIWDAEPRLGDVFLNLADNLRARRKPPTVKQRALFKVAS